MILAIELILAGLVITGSITLVWGARHFKLSSQVLAIAFAITAASWMAFLITTISLTVRTFALSSV